MRLLVSVRRPAEARAARRGGADVIDAKDPARGALGPVAPARLAAICRAAGPCRPVSAALGEAPDPGVLRRGGFAVRTGVAFVKLGFRGMTSARQALEVAERMRCVVGPDTGLVLVAYADWRRVGALEPEEIVRVAADARAQGVLLDTAVKTAGTTLFTLVPVAAVAAWVAAAGARGLFAGLAGSLGGSDFATARAVGAALVGVRGAACVGGRTGQVSAARVARLRAFAGAPLGAFVGALA